MAVIQTDLALEAAHAIMDRSGKDHLIHGVHMQEYEKNGYHVTAIAIRTRLAGRALGKPNGTYITVDLEPYFLREDRYFSRGVMTLAEELRRLLPPMGKTDTVLVAGLGNRSLISDAVGPTAVDHLLVTRHMVRHLPRQFSCLNSVAALSAGVLGQTGMEAVELLSGAVAQIHPACVVAVDALTARSRKRLCATVQLSDSGLVPGSGVGNHRCAVDRKTLGVPVIAVGLPTVMSGSVLAKELTGRDAKQGSSLFVTTRDVDSRVRELGRLLGYGITAALQPALTVEDITGLLG